MVLNNKKAQGFQWEQIIIILILAVAAFLVVYGFWVGWDFVFGKLGLLPDDLESARAACQAWSSSDSTAITFCSFKEFRLEGKKQWANCVQVYDVAVKSIEQEKIGFKRDAITCSSDVVLNKCIELMATKGVKSSVIVNGQTCQSTLIAKGKTCEALNGETKEACSSGQSDIASWISSDSTASKCCYPAGKVCTAGNPSASCSIILKADCAKYGCPYVSGDTCSSNSNVDCSKVPSDKCGIYNCGLPAA